MTTDVILSEERAEAMREAFEELGRGRPDLRLDALTLPAGLSEAAPPPSGTRTLMTRAVLDALAQDPAGVIASDPVRRTSYHAALRTTAVNWAAWVEGSDDLRPVALAAFYQFDKDTLTITLWAEVREQVLQAVADFEAEMAGEDWLRRSI